jgi:hypothetical protein
MQIIYIEKIKEENRTLLMDATGGLTKIDKNMEVYLLKDISDLRKLGFHMTHFQKWKCVSQLKN